MSMDTYGIIGFTTDNVGIDRRFYTGRTDTDPTLPVSYNERRVDVYLNGIKLVGDHPGNSDHDYDINSQTGQGSSITIRTGVALVSADVIECIGYVSLAGNTVTSHNPTPTSGDGGYNEFRNIGQASSDLLNVYLNGVLLDDSDYTSDPTANGGTVTIGNPAITASDIVVIQVIGTLNNSNFVPAGGGTFSGNVTHSGTLTANGTINANSTIDMQGSELILDADADTSFHASTDDQIDIKVAGTDVGNFNSNTLKLTKDNTPKLIVEDTNSSDFTVSGKTYWLTGPELNISHATSDANAEGVLGTIKFTGTTKTNLGIASDPGSQDLISIQGRTIGQGNQQRYSDVIGALRILGMNGAGGFTELMAIEGKTLKIASGGGIDFSATSNDSGMQSETLSDYEEGTWNPTIRYQNSTDHGNATNNTQNGFYVRVGNMVTVQCYLIWTLTGSPANDNMSIDGFPFSVYNGDGAMRFAVALFTSGSDSTPTNGWYGIMYNNQNVMYISDQNDNGNKGDEWGAGTNNYVSFTVTYRVA